MPPYPQRRMGISPSKTCLTASPNSKQVIFRDGTFAAFEVVLRCAPSKMHSSLKGDRGIKKTNLFTEVFLESLKWGPWYW